MRLGYLNIVLLTTCLPLAASAQSVSLTADDGAAKVATEKRAWMGVSVTPVPPALRHQLKTPDGIGLLIDFVQPKSPADEAGLKPYDLILKLNDQWLVNPEQFAVLVRMHKAAEEVKLSFIREGAEQSATVKLIDHEVPKSLDRDGAFPWPNDPFSARAMQTPAADPDHNPTFNADAEKVITWLDGRKQVSIVTSHGHSTLDVKDNVSGQVLFSGPIDTEEQRKSLPPDIRSKLDSLSQITSEFEGKISGRNDSDKPVPPKDGQSSQPDGAGSR
ncbi:MAG TPA: PDZ domain-containing protein [Bryobacteraceae bacterium]|jgi:hypothetical protein